jgi:hypothetical protein
MDYLQILESIETLTVEDVACPKIELDDLQVIHPSLTLDKPLTYKVFLSKREDLSDEEKEVIQQIISKLEYNEKIKYEHYLNVMNEFKVIEPVQNNIKIIDDTNEEAKDLIYSC